MIRAAALIGRPVDAGIREVLEPIRGDEVTVRFLPFPRRRMWPTSVAAMTMPWAIYIRPEVLAADEFVVRRLIVHELVHARQWKTLGVSRFLSRYLTEYLRNRLAGMSHPQAYRAISLEVEAYAIADQLVRR